MIVTLGYGRREISAEVPDGSFMGALLPNDSQRAEVLSALERPVGAPPLRDVVKPGEKVAIVTSDITRPVPGPVILPPIVDALNAAGIPDRDITVVFALGSHRKHTQAEQRALVGGALWERVACVDSDERQCVSLGRTSRGTPVEIFEPVVRADRRVCVGNIEYHYFAGFSGGAKAILPGVATRATIQANHAMMVREGARTGRIEGNPVRADIDEVLSLLSVDYIVNAVLDDHKRILRVFAGHPIAAHRAGCRYLDAIYKVAIPAPADIVLATPGGYPKDINLYQAQKALDNAALAVRDGGVIVLAASCCDGLGEPEFERWMLSMEPGDMVPEIRRNFVLGGHKAAAIAMVLRRASVFLVSDMDPDLVRKLHFTPFACVADALAEARARLGRNARTLVLPAAGSTMPVVEAKPSPPTPPPGHCGRG